MRFTFFSSYQYFCLIRSHTFSIACQMDQNIDYKPNIKMCAINDQIEYQTFEQHERDMKGWKKVHKACISIAIASAFYLHFRQIHTAREKQKKRKTARIQRASNRSELHKANKNRHRVIHDKKKEGKNRGDYPRNANKWLVVSKCYRNIPIHNAHISKRRKHLHDNNY